MGPKKLSLNITYNNQSKPFVCELHEVAKEISSHFKINLSDVTMYAVSREGRYKVTPKDVKDMMKIEIVPNKNGQKTLPDCFELEASKKMVENMISKLRQNTSLTGQERKVLIEALETHSTAIFRKRKLEQTDIARPEVFNKKVQVKMPNKESFCQTDPLIIPSDIENPINSEEDAKQTMKRLLSHGDVNKEQIDLLMKETFDERRNFITITCPPVAVVREQYPALFCLEQVKNELDRIFYLGKCKDFLENMSIYTKHILHYKESKIEDILEITEKARSRARTPKQKTYAEVVGSIFVLTKLLDEDFGFIHLIDHPHSSKDVFPYIDASLYSLQKIFFDDILFHIMVEGKHLCEASNFPEAMLCLMASFFIFNIDYPESCRCTLTVIEKVHLKANDTVVMDDKTEQWIKLLTMREIKSRNLGNESKKNHARLDTYLRS